MISRAVLSPLGNGSRRAPECGGPKRGNMTENKRAKREAGGTDPPPEGEKMLYTDYGDPGGDRSAGPGRRRRKAWARWATAIAVAAILAGLVAAMVVSAYDNYVSRDTGQVPMWPKNR